MDVHASLGSLAKVLRYVLQSALLGIGAYLVVIEQASGGIMIASSIVMGRALAPIEKIVWLVGSAEQHGPRLPRPADASCCRRPSLRRRLTPRRCRARTAN